MLLLYKQSSGALTLNSWAQNLPSTYPDRTPSILFHTKTNHWTKNGKWWWETGTLEDLYVLILGCICVTFAESNIMRAPKNAHLSHVYLDSTFSRVTPVGFPLVTWIQLDWAASQTTRSSPYSSTWTPTPSSMLAGSSLLFYPMTVSKDQLIC